MKGWDRPPRAVGFVAIARYYKSWPPVAFDHARGGDPDHPAMPSVTVDYQAKRFAQSGIFRDALLDLFEDSAFFLLPLAVQFVQANRYPASSLGLFCAEQIDYIPRNIHPPGSIDARRDPECNLARAQRPSAEVGNLQQCLQAEVLRRSQGIQPKAGDHPIFTNQRYGVGN